MEFKEILHDFTKDFAILFYSNFAKYVLPAILFVLLMLLGTKLAKYIWHNLKDHVKSELKSSHTVSQTNRNATLTCPRCGGKLVLRTAKRGDRVGKQFYGCSNYPRCNYTRNV